MRRTSGPGTLTVYELEPGQHLSVCRIVRAPEIDDPVFLNSLRSNFELDAEPRKIERRWTVIHMGISVFSAVERARFTAQRWEKLGR